MSTCGPEPGGAEGTRTPDPHTASVVRYQLRHSPKLPEKVIKQPHRDLIDGSRIRTGAGYWPRRVVSQSTVVLTGAPLYSTVGVAIRPVAACNAADDAAAAAVAAEMFVPAVMHEAADAGA